MGIKRTGKYLYHELLGLTSNFLSVKLLSQIIYRIKTGKKLNLDNPTTFNEKIHWLKLNSENELVYISTDKFLVRDYIQKKGLEGILNPLYGVFEKGEEIEFERFPQKFVLKTTHGASQNIIIRDKGTINQNEIIKQMNKWLNYDYGKKYLEPQYSKHSPKIICESFIETVEGTLPNDYKFFCFNGRPKLIMVTFERDDDNTKHSRVFYDTQWRKKKITKEDITEEIEKPVKLEEMLKIASVLSSDFPFARIDLFNIAGKVLFGEITLTPYGGNASYFTDEAALELGSWIELPVKE
ncbi:hypothetical protein LI951_05645 [Enterococcus sp. BWT-B8]|uniref:ATP-grasp fold amidoligase family protein n=1 Tax=Enterococcus sp. BWT-B8 TaxID=2885157 RepID=UPI001E4E604D|nr:ATP-grasp fold amidoligase family protein [Enterococcus sp. BWT-B8]MCB5951541.1 hypothetical protein [Enterococcus sp. BWT-B8]